MPKRRRDDEDLDDEEYPQPDEDDDGDDTVPCPHCRKPVYEDAELCPHCGNYLSREDSPGRPPVWLLVGVLACLAVVLMWILRP